jgi:hypothetical protein
VFTQTLEALAGRLRQRTKRSWTARHRTWIALLLALVAGLSIAGAGSSSAAVSIENMPLWRIQVRVTTGSAGTDGHPAFRFNPSATGVRTLNPPSHTAFDANRVDTFDVRLFKSPSEITMLRVGLAGSDDWCVKKVELIFNGRLAFSRDAVPGGACATIRGGTYLEFSRTDLRTNPAWVNYGTPPSLPLRMTAATLRAHVTSVTGSTMLSAPGVHWNPAVAVQVVKKTNHSFKVTVGLTIVDPSGIESSFNEKITYDVVLVTGTDGRMHATKANASCCYHYGTSDAVVAQLDAALSRLTVRPTTSNNPLRFGVDAQTNINWSWVPVIGRQ